MTTLGLPMSPAQARAHVATLQLPRLVLTIADGAEPPEILRFLIRPPSRAFRPGTAVPTGFVPVFDASTTVVGYLLAEQHFVEISLESPALTLSRHRTFRGVLAQLLLELWETDLESDEDILAIAADLGFSGGPALLERLHQGGYVSREVIASFDA
jgi:hypothetical protein